MGLKIRKSVKVGPLRFNLSNSGMGISAGIRGLRVGTGPRGNYIRMGSGGLSYRVSLPRTNPVDRRAKLVGGDPDLLLSEPPLSEIESTNVEQMQDASSAELLEELRAKQRTKRTWPPLAIGFSLMMVLCLLGSAPGWVLPAILAAAILFVSLAARHDALTKSVVMLYDLDPEVQLAYERLLQWAEKLGKVGALWHIEAEGAVRDHKYQAGASRLVRRKRISVRKSQPPHVKTNIETIAIPVGRQVMYFFPDRLLIYEADSVGAVDYSVLGIDVGPHRFIEDGGVPGDAQVVDQTWQYVNRGGGPDRRFKSNPRLPICRYDEVYFHSPSGLREAIQVSRVGIADGFATAVRYLASLGSRREWV